MTVASLLRSDWLSSRVRILNRDSVGGAANRQACHSLAADVQINFQTVLLLLPRTVPSHTIPQAVIA